MRELLGEHDPEAARIEGATVGLSPADAMSERSSVVEVPRDASVRRSASGLTTDSTDNKDPDRGRTGQRKRAGRRRSDVGDPDRTIGDAMRTHAVPREGTTHSELPSKQGELSTGSLLFRDPSGKRLRRARRRTGAWLLLMTLLPTLGIGLWTYRTLSQRWSRQVGNELSGLARASAVGVETFLNRRAEQTRRWAGDDEVVAMVRTLNQLALGGDDDTLRTSPIADELDARLRALVGTPDVKYVIWNRSYETVASWTPDREDVGGIVMPSGAANLARAARGDTVLFGPQRLGLSPAEGFDAETDRPVVAIIVPIRDGDRVIAEMLIRGMGWFDELEELMTEFSLTTGTDAYIVRDDMLATTPPAAAIDLGIAPKLIAGLIRVVDPGPNGRRADRSSRPLTEVAAELRRGETVARPVAYPNYAGRSVIGAGRPIANWDLGVVIERDAATIDSSLTPVKWGFGLLGGLMSLMSVGVAYRLARPAAEESETHPLGRYDVLETLGSGGMGAVYRVHHRSLGRDAALKILRGDRQHPDDRARFDREARLAAALDSPHTVTIYDYGRTSDGDAYCVMQYLKGLTLHEIVARDGPQPIGRVLVILQQVCDAVCEAHAAGLTHRDIKPHNIMVLAEGAVGDWAVIFDYGLAKPLAPSDEVFQTLETVWSGTPMYMPPERFRNPTSLDPRSDLYSIGTVAYWLLSGRPPFAQSDPESLFSLILNETPLDASIQRGEPLPQGVADWLRRAMAKDVEERFQDARSMAAELDRLRIDHPWRAEESAIWWKIYGGR